MSLAQLLSKPTKRLKRKLENERKKDIFTDAENITMTEELPWDGGFQRGSTKNDFEQ